MFKKTINFSSINSKKLLTLKDYEVIQIVQKNSETKVLMTQENYLNLLSRIEIAERSSKISEFNPEKSLNLFKNKVSKIEKVLKRNSK